MKQRGPGGFFQVSRPDHAKVTVADDDDDLVLLKIPLQPLSPETDRLHKNQGEARTQKISIIVSLVL